MRSMTIMLQHDAAPVPPVEEAGAPTYRPSGMQEVAAEISCVEWQKPLCHDSVFPPSRRSIAREAVAHVQPCRVCVTGRTHVPCMWAIRLEAHAACTLCTEGPFPSTSWL